MSQSKGHVLLCKDPVWRGWGLLLRRGMSWRWGSGDKIFVVFKNKFHNLPWLIAFYSQSRQGISFAASLCSKTCWSFLEQGNSMGRGGGSWAMSCKSWERLTWQVRPGWAQKAPPFLASSFSLLFFFKNVGCLFQYSSIVVFFAFRFLGRGMWILLKRIDRGC